MHSASEWTGATGDAWAAEWRRTDRSFAALAPHLDSAILAAAPAGAFRALDLGCGAGATGQALAMARHDAAVVGVDLSAELIAVARARPPLGNLHFVVGDAVAEAARVNPDLYVSRHGVMFFDDSVAAFAGMAQGAAAGAGLVFSCFAEPSANRFVADLFAALGRPMRDSDAPGPFAFADPARVAAILAAAGWSTSAPTRVDFAYRAGDGGDPVADAVAFFRRIGPVAALLRDAAETDRPAMEAAIAEACAARLRDGAVDFPAVAWIWSATL